MKGNNEPNSNKAKHGGTAPKKRKKWRKFYHNGVFGFLKLFFVPFMWLKCGYTFKMFDNRRQPYLILSNHQTPYDPFMVGVAMRKVAFCVASEDIFSIGFVSKIIRFLVAPIPFIKSTADFNSVLTLTRVAKEGNSIILFPEGNRTYSGKTETIKPSIVKLIKMLKLPVAFFAIKGGYGVLPRWADKPRRGKMSGGVRRILTYEQYKDMPDDVLYELVKSELFIDESTGGSYHSKHAAEYLERVIYVCPHCGITQFASNGAELKCLTCGLTAHYTPEKQFEGGVPYKNVNEWYEAQQSYIRALDLSKLTEKPICEDRADLGEVIVYRHKNRLEKAARVRLFGDRIEITGGKTRIIGFFEMEGATVLGRNKLNVYQHGKIYQIKGGKRFNAVKYVNIIYRSFAANGGVNDDKRQFLGL